MATIEISGYPLPEPIRFENVSPDTITDPAHWLLAQPQATALAEQWRDADRDGGPGDVATSTAYLPLGVITTALHIDHEVVLSHWEAATGSDGTDLYSTATMPWEFTVRLLPD